MNVHTLLNGFRTQIVLAIAIISFLSVSALPTNAQGNGPEGTWLVRVSVEDAPPGFPVPFDALETYGRGGGFITSNKNPLIPRPGQGTWYKNGDEYAVYIIFFLFDPVGTPIGTVEVTHRFKINGKQYRGRGEASFKNSDGGPLFAEHPQPFNFNTRGRRVSEPTQ